MKCRICGSEIVCYEKLQDVPYDVNSVYTKPVEKSQRGGMSAEFGYCKACKHGQMEYTLEEEHYKAYNLLNVGDQAVAAGGNANLRREYYESMLQELKELCADHDKLLDIGCGHGTLMNYAKGIFQRVKGVEPSAVECRIAEENGCDVVNAFFDKNWHEEGFSAFISTQVLEHLPDLEEVINTAYRILKPGGVGYFDVPNGHAVYADSRYFDVYMEHINYFSTNSLARILTKCGFSIISIREIFDGSHIAAYVRKEKNRIEFEKHKENDIKKLQSILPKYKSVSVWGAGIKGRSYIQNVIVPEEEHIKHIFDNNSALNGLYIGDCRIPVELPTKEAVNQNDLMIITALEYKNEIIRSLREQYKFCGEIIDIGEIAQE